MIASPCSSCRASFFPKLLLFDSGFLWYNTDCVLNRPWLGELCLYVLLIGGVLPASGLTARNRARMILVQVKTVHRKPVFVTGGTGYVGQPLIAELLRRGHAGWALARRGSESRVPAGATPVIGDALDASTFAHAIPPEATVVHLVGTAHPSPAKASEFRRVDLPSIRATVEAVWQTSAWHLIYVSIAHPAPIMRAYIAVRKEGEALVRSSGVPATILRPWYVLGPGHRWPIALLPVYAVLRRVPATRDTAERLGLVSRQTMVAALVRAVEVPVASGVRVFEVPEIRQVA